MAFFNIPRVWVVVVLLAMGIDASATPFDLAGESARARLQELAARVEAADPMASVRFEAAILHHMISAEGDKAHAASAVELLEPFVQAKQDNTLALAFLGSARTLMGRDARNPLLSVERIKKGLKDMDRAVEISGDDLSVRLVRAQNSTTLPSMFGRMATFDTDVEHMLAFPDQIENAEVTIRAHCHLLIGDYHKNKTAYDLAFNSWQRVLELAPTGSKVHDEAQARMALFQP